MNLELSRSFGDTLEDKETLISIAGEIGETLADSALNDGLIKDIPIVSTVVAFYHIGGTLREQHHLRKLAKFVQGIGEGTVSDKERHKYAKEFKENPEFHAKELEYIFLILDRYLEEDKAKMLSALYLAYLRKEIDLVQFKQYAEVVDRFLPGDYETLMSASVGSSRNRSYLDDSILRLSALGLVVDFDKNDDIGFESSGIYKRFYHDMNIRFKPTDFGGSLIHILSTMKR